MTDVIDVLRYVNVAAFVTLALACCIRWRKVGDATTRWATVAFGSLAMVSVISLVLRASPTTHYATWFVRAILVVLVVFPYCIFRFAIAFERPTRAMSVFAGVATAAVVVATIALPYLPLPRAPLPVWWQAYRALFVVQWSVLFTAVAARLWLASRNEAGVVRSRMRTLAYATTGLNAAVLLSGVVVSRPPPAVVVTTQVLSLAAAVLFFVGLVPPAWLMRMWRWPEAQAFQRAMGTMLRAETCDELTAVLLPLAARLVGARSAALVSRDGEILAVHGPGEGAAPAFQRLPFGAGELLLWTSAYAPFFGRDDMAMLEWLGSFADIVLDRCVLAEQQRRSQAELRHQATHDALTGLPNRVLLEDRVEQALARSRRNGSRVAALFLDVDRFKIINDSMGHGAGDELLRTVAQRLQAMLRPGDTVARFGGDEFVVVTEDWEPDDAPVAVAARIAEGLSVPARVEDADVVTTVSIGVAIAGSDADAGALLQDADAAMYRAKEQGKDRCVLFDSAMREAADSRLATERALRRALDRGELQVHYQPIVEIETGRLAGVEALARWQPDERAPVPPGEFIPVAEETGLIIRLGALVLHEACRQVALWRQETPELGDLTLSVNLSANQLLNPGLVEQVGSALAAAGLPPSALCLEITETVLLDDTEACARSLDALHDLGVQLGVDDFGTGYSSLSYLKRLPVDVLKIDQSFVGGLGGETSPQDRAIVAGIVDLANAFGLRTVAEGVEAGAQLQELGALGCHVAQGFHFCRPLDAHQAGEWMRRWSADTLPAPAERRSVGLGGVFAGFQRRHELEEA
ncbi:MAG TPA: EAL domain-containing protein [Acidimicrobiales bacterium]|nr:EAL domain-containing protein [Acidimicrobiales bacterium]